MSSDRDTPHTFGGAWTQAKLDCLDKYLKSYLIALKKQAFNKGYIDAFAGTSVRVDRGGPSADAPMVGLLNDAYEEEGAQWREGSTSVALRHDFGGYVFIEKNPQRVRDLEQLAREHPDKKIQIRQGDANEELRRIAATPKGWRDRRAVVFLDPYGMQVEWATVEALAHTRAMDVWMLIPLGIAITRMLPHHGHIEDHNRRSLDRYFGDAEWYDALYRTVEREGLFGTETALQRADLSEIEAYIMDRLRSVFPSVSEPGYLYNGGRTLLYLLCFAAGDPKGGVIGCKIANHLIKKLNERTS